MTFKDRDKYKHKYKGKQMIYNKVFEELNQKKVKQNVFKVLKNNMKEFEKKKAKQKIIKQKVLKELKVIDEKNKATKKKVKQKVFKVLKKKVKEVEKNKAKQKILRRKVFKALKAKFELNKRSTVEHNFAEFVIALLIDNISINTTEELFRIIDNFDETKTKICFNAEGDKEEYIKDTYKKNYLLEDYINNFRKIDSSFWRNIKNIYISGKTNKHKFVDNLNKGFDRKETKSDIYIEYLDKPPIGISVKQSSDAQKSNYSIEKMAGIYEPGLSKSLSENRRAYCRSHNYYGLKGLNAEEKKQRRDFVNNLFHIKNPHFDALMFYIEKYKIEFGIDLVNYLNSTAVPYNVYEFDGKEMIHLNKNRNFKNIRFELHEPYKYKKNNNLRNDAKIYYQLTYDDKKYKVEVRFKTDIYTSSAQFCIHND